MGIQGLLPVLKNITQTVHVSKYKGHKVAVDAYCWLHRAAYCCSEEICEGQFTDKHVVFCMQKVQMLQHCGVTPIVVFDGGRLPMKAAEEGSRHRARQENRDKAAAHVKAGNRQAALECYQRAVGISPETANEFVQALKTAGVDFIVAPFEADAQMAYLAINDMVHAVITEDSDLLPYGCPRVLFKMGKTGEGQEVVAADLANNRELSFIGFTPHMFLEMCIFAGCDFLKALPGIGMKKAHQHVKRLKSHRKVCKSLRFSGIAVPRDYEPAFQRAVWTFQHQRVWCPKQKQLVHVRPLPAGGLASVDAVPGALSEDDPTYDFLGPVRPDNVAQQVAEAPLCSQPAAARLHSAPPERPQQTPARFWNLQRRSSGSRASGERKPPTLPVQANGITSYFPSLAASSDALQQFSAPRPALRSRSNSPSLVDGAPATDSPSANLSKALAQKSSFFSARPQTRQTRHSCLGHTQQSTANNPHTEEHKVATSPAGKASRHLSGCGSQPEPLQHPFSSFASTSTRQAAQAAKQRITAADAEPDALAPPYTDRGQILTDASASEQLKSLLASSTEPAVAADNACESNSSADAAARLSNLMTARVETDSGNTTAQLGELEDDGTHAVQCTVPETPEKAGPSSPQISPFKLAAEKQTTSQQIDECTATIGSHCQRAVQSGVGTSAVKLDSAQQPIATSIRAAKRRTSSHFGSAPKRQRSSDHEEVPLGMNPHSMLDGLVNKLQARRPGSATSRDLGLDDGVDIDLDRSSSANDDRVDGAHAADDGDMSDPDVQHAAIAGLEHIQPFAGVAKLAVDNITAASLQRFGMSKKEASSRQILNKPHADVLQPFAPPRRRVSIQDSKLQRRVPSFTPGIVTPLEQFACGVTSDP